VSFRAFTDRHLHKACRDVGLAAGVLGVMSTLYIREGPPLPLIKDAHLPRSHFVGLTKEQLSSSLARFVHFFTISHFE
jgi:hypothetical protein